MLVRIGCDPQALAVEPAGEGAEGPAPADRRRQAEARMCEAAPLDKRIHDLAGAHIPGKLHQCATVPPARCPAIACSMVTRAASRYSTLAPLIGKEISQ